MSDTEPVVFIDFPEPKKYVVNLEANHSRLGIIFLILKRFHMEYPFRVTE